MYDEAVSPERCDCDADDPDGDFFRGFSDDLPAFGVPIAAAHEGDGQLPWWSLDDAGERLIRFAHRFGSYDWSNDPEEPTRQRLLAALAHGQPDDPVDDDCEFLWHTLFAVIRADRFNEGLIAAHALALTRIANELRRRLVRGRIGA